MPTTRNAARRKGSAMPTPVARRIADCRTSMAKHDLPAYLLTRQVNSFYATGFTGEDSAVLITMRDVHIISDARFDLAIDQEAPWAVKRLRTGNNLLVDEVAATCRDLNLPELGVGAESVTADFLSKLRKLAKPTRIVTAPPIVTDLRVCKDEHDLKWMLKAIDVAQEAFRAAIATIEVGQTESEVAARLEYEMRRRGSSSPAFATIVAVNANAAHPHAHAGKRKVTSGGLILLDWGATVGCYRSDLTRCLFVNRIPPRLGRVYDVVLDAQRAAIDAVQPGRRMCDVDRVARDIITDAGFGKQFVHGLGHGLGLDVHEAPSLSWRSKQPLEPGMVVTVEPGIYLPGVGGIRIEDDVLVTGTGHRVLSTLDTDKVSAVI